MPADRPEPPANEVEAFRQAIGPIEPHRCDLVEPWRAPRPPLPLQKLADEKQVLRDMVSDHFEPADLETGEHLSYSREGVQDGVLRKLKRGQYSLGAQLDLHGLTWAEARVTVHAFLSLVQRDRVHCVRIVHGKGNRSRHLGPVLKQKLNVYLRLRDDVLAFCSARPDDGGTGALYVLLRSR
ncbi:MAG: DNA mismatch repair protein MutS [Ottowia sp.]|nr:MAG: DNA mismatch repair protein MutS [Ottowia sp.]